MDSPLWGSVLSGPVPNHPEWQSEVSDKKFEEMVEKSKWEWLMPPSWAGPPENYQWARKSYVKSTRSDGISHQKWPEKIDISLGQENSIFLLIGKFLKQNILCHDSPKVGC